MLKCKGFLFLQIPFLNSDLIVFRIILEIFTHFISYFSFIIFKNASQLKFCKALTHYINTTIWDHTN